MWRSIPDDSKQILAPGLAIQRNKIPDYMFAEFGECVRAWKKWNEKSLLPYSGGWAEQPADLITVFDVFDAVLLEHEKAEAEMRQLERQHNARTR